MGECDCNTATSHKGGLSAQVLSDGLTSEGIPSVTASTFHINHINYVKLQCENCYCSWCSHFILLLVAFLYCFWYRLFILCSHSRWTQNFNFWHKLLHTCAAYVVAVKCSRNHFISEKYKTVQSFKLRFLQNSPFLQLYTSASECKDVGNVFWKPFYKILFSSTFAFWMMTLVLKIGVLWLRIPCKWTGKKKTAATRLGEHEKCSSVVTLLFARKPSL
jgi:hypothetical protein